MKVVETNCVFIVERYTTNRLCTFPEFTAVFSCADVFPLYVSQPKCSEEDFCYVETPSTDGYIYGGRVPCICPKEYYCPIYFIRNKRVPQLNDDGRVISYGLRCKRRMY